MKHNEQLHDYTNRFFENRNICVGVRVTRLLKATKRTSRIANL
jgi:hypothetical protein